MNPCSSTLSAALSASFREMFHMIKRTAPPFGLLTPVLAEDLADGMYRRQTAELAWVSAPLEEPNVEDEPTVEVEAP